MIYLEKSSDAIFQERLNEVKKKDKEGGYRDKLIFDQLKKDFHGKCYLCESKPTAIEIDHLEPHRGDLDKKFDWGNLFYACRHCNNTKSDKFFPLLNCTDIEDKVWESVKFEISMVDKDLKVYVSLVEKPISEKSQNTIQLLEKVFTGANSTPAKLEEAHNLRNEIIRPTYKKFLESIMKKDVNQIREAIDDAAPFSGMLRWVLKNDFPRYFAKIYTDHNANSVQT